MEPLIGVGIIVTGILLLIFRVPVRPVRASLDEQVAWPRSR